MSTRRMTLTAMLTAMLCLLGPLTLPLGPVPLSLTTALLMLMGLLLGGGKATLCCAVYLLMGLVGLPVFSGFSGGAGALLGPTGGFLLGYLPMTALCGFVCAAGEPARPAGGAPCGHGAAVSHRHRMVLLAVRDGGVRGPGGVRAALPAGGCGQNHRRPYRRKRRQDPAEKGGSSLINPSVSLTAASSPMKGSLSY